MRKIAILSLIIFSTLFLNVSSFALTKEERAWKEDILTLLSLVRKVGDYSEVVDLIEVAPALKKDPEISKAFITFAPPGATPPEWAQEEKVEKVKVKKVAEIKEPEEKQEIEIKEIPVEVEKGPSPPAIEAEVERVARGEVEAPRAEPVEVKEKEIKDYYRMGKKYYGSADYQRAIRKFERVLEINPLHKKARKYLIKSHYEMGEKFYRNQAYRQASIEYGKILALEPGHKKAKEYLSECQTRVRVEVARKVPEEVIPEAKPIEEGPPEKIVMAEEVPIEEEIKEEIEEEIGIKPTSLPEGVKIIHSTDVVSKVEVQEVEGKMRVIITLSGERKYTVSERGRPPAIVIDIPYTINAVSPERIMVNQGGVRMIEVAQHRAVPFDETRVIIRLSRFKEYEIRSKENEIHVEFEE